MTTQIETFRRIVPEELWGSPVYSVPVMQIEDQGETRTMRAEMHIVGWLPHPDADKGREG